MSQELVEHDRRFRKEVPSKHRQTLDTRLMWLWNQRSGTVQAVWEGSPDMLDHTAATMILQALFGKDLNSIALLIRRLEGGALTDDVIVEQDLKI